MSVFIHECTYQNTSQYQVMLFVKNIRGFDVAIIRACAQQLLLGFTHVIRLALGGQAKSEHGYRIELITYHSY